MKTRITRDNNQLSYKKFNDAAAYKNASSNW